MAVLVFQRIVPPYRLAVFRRLYRQFGAIVCHSRERKGASLLSAGAELDVPNEAIGRIYLGGKETAALQNILSPLLRHRPRTVISEFATSYFSLWLLIWLRPLFGYRLLMWTHGVNNNEVLQPFAGRRGKVAAWLLRRADGLLLYSEGRARLLRAAFDDSTPPLFVAPNTIDTRKELELCRSFDRRGKAALREELGMQSRYHLVYIGRLIPEKRIDLLLESFARIAAKADATLHIIGDGPERVLLDQFSGPEDSLRFHGSVWDAGRSGALLYAADLCLNPGYVGLSIVHNFCYKTPVLTCSVGPGGPWHSPEIDYLRDGQNGAFAAANPEAIAAGALALLQDEQRLEELSAEAHATALKACSLDAMMHGFEDALQWASGGANKPGELENPDRIA